MAKALGQFQFRRDTAANWTTHNPVLLDGELGRESDTNLFKFGDGVSNWNDLEYGGLQGKDGNGTEVSIRRGKTENQELINGDFTVLTFEATQAIEGDIEATSTVVTFNEGGNYHLSSSLRLLSSPTGTVEGVVVSLEVSDATQTTWTRVAESVRLEVLPAAFGFSVTLSTDYVLEAGAGCRVRVYNEGTSGGVLTCLAVVSSGPVSFLAIHKIGTGGYPVIPVDLGLYIAGQPADEELLYKMTLSRELTLAGDMLGSVGSVGTNPTSTATLNVKKNNDVIGSVSISTGGVVSFTTVDNDPVTFAVGNSLSIENQATADATLADVALTFVFTRGA